MKSMDEPGGGFKFGKEVVPTLKEKAPKGTTVLSGFVGGFEGTTSDLAGGYYPVRQRWWVPRVPSEEKWRDQTTIIAMVV